jgi:TatD DNase family protein
MLKDEDLDIFIKRALDNGVHILQTICTKLSDVEFIYNIIDKYENIYGSIGIHPNETKNNLIDYDHLKNLISHKKIISIGETGLDYYYEYSDKILQKKSFITHIQLSQSEALPIIVHTRDAEYDTKDILTSEMLNQKFTGLIHCFTSSKDFARKILNLGLYISFSGIITFKNALELHEIVKFVPLDRILIETDAPYLAPVPKRGQQNEPAFVKYVAEHISMLKNLDLNLVINKTTQNFKDLFLN